MFEYKMILYRLSTSGALICSFLVLLFLIGCVLYIKIKKFKMKYGKIVIYGMLLNLSSRDIFSFAGAIIRTFLIAYSLIIYAGENLTLYLLMIGISSVIFIISYRKNIIYESLNTVLLMVLVYFNNQLDSYLINIEKTIPVLVIKYILVIFGLLYITYILLKEVEELITKNEKVKD